MKRLWLLLSLILASVACSVGGVNTPEATPAVDTGWQTAAPGLEYRITPMPSSYGNANAHMVRVNPTLNTIRVHYEPENARTVRAWHTDLDALVTVNAGFFFPDDTSLGLIVADGTAAGDSFNQVGGMFSIDSTGTLDLRSLSQEPYTAGEDLQQAVQGRPMLVFPGGVPTNFRTNGEPTRRTIIATDTAGHLLLIVFPTSTANLDELQAWLVSLGAIDAALNLDGGGSTGLVLTTETVSERFNSLTPVPSVLAITPVE